MIGAGDFVFDCVDYVVFTVFTVVVVVLTVCLFGEFFGKSSLPLFFWLFGSTPPHLVGVVLNFFYCWCCVFSVAVVVKVIGEVVVAVVVVVIVVMVVVF